jgi:hypothetical protein
MTEEDIVFRARVLLTFQVSLLGMVTCHLRGVTVGWEAGKILAYLYFDGEIGDEEFEISVDIEGEVAASFPGHEIYVRPRRLDAPTPLNPEMLKEWVYRRKE